MSAARRLEFLVPGRLDQRTGGYLYDARMIAGLRARGWSVRVHEIEGRFPEVDDEARRAFARAIASCTNGDTVLIDGLALLGLESQNPDSTPQSRHFIALVHHPLSDETGLDSDVRDRYARMERAALARCRGAIVTSAYTATRLAELGVSGDRVRVAEPGTRPSEPARGPANGCPPRLLCVGTVIPRKGHHVLIQALSKLRHLSWDCVCAGSRKRDPDYVRQVDETVDSIGLGARVTFVGELAGWELAELYATASVFVLPSYYEGFGMALTEALARGLPIVSTTGGAIPYTVPYDAAILVEPGDPTAFANAIETVLSDRGASLQTSASRHAAQLRDWPRAVLEFERALWELMSLSPRSLERRRHI